MLVDPEDICIGDIIERHRWPTFDPTKVYTFKVAYMNRVGGKLNAFFDPSGRPYTIRHDDKFYLVGHERSKVLDVSTVTVYAVELHGQLDSVWLDLESARQRCLEIGEFATDILVMSARGQISESWPPLESHC